MHQVFPVERMSRLADYPMTGRQPGSATKDIVKPDGKELVIKNCVNSAFIGANLEILLSEHGSGTLITAGPTND